MIRRNNPTVSNIKLKTLFYLFFIIFSIIPGFSQIKKGSPPVYNINATAAVGCTRLTDINSLVFSSGFVLPAYVNSSDFVFPEGGNTGCLVSVPNQYWFLIKVDSTINGTLNFGFTNSSNYDIDGAIYGPVFNNDLNYACSAVTNPPLTCDFGSEPDVRLTLTNVVNNKYYIIVLTNYSNQNTNININQPFGGQVKYYIPNDCVVKAASIEGNYSITAGQSAQLKVSYSVNPPVNLNIENFGQIVATTNPQFISVSPSQTSQYRILTATSPQCGSLTPTGLATVLVQNNSNQNKLVSCFEFDNNFLDEKGINQAFNTSVGFTSDRFGNPNRAALFTGNNYLNVTSNDFLNGQYTFSAWVKFNSIPPTNTYTCLFSVGNDGGDQSFGVMNNYGANFTGDRPKWVLPNYIGYGQGGGYPMANDTLTVDNWNLITMTRGSDSLKIYINGIRKASVSANGSSPYYAGNIAKIGSRYFGGQGFNGAMDELKIFSGALSESEVRVLFLKQSCNYEYLNFRERSRIFCLPFENGFQEMINNIPIIQSNINLTPDRNNNLNSAVQFNENSLFELSSPILFSQTYSTSLWFYPTSTAPLQTLFSMGTSPYDHNVKLENSVRTGNLFKLVFSSTINNSGIKSVLISNEVSLNSWHHVLVIREQQRIIFYLDGVKVAEGSFSNSISNYFGQSPRFYIGSNFGTEKFIGKIDDFKAFSGPLFDSEAKSVYASLPNNCSFIECPPFRKVQGINNSLNTSQSSLETEVLNHNIVGNNANFLSERSVILKPGAQLNNTTRIEIRACDNNF